MEPLIIKNRKITASDLKFIQAVVYQHWDKGRTHISRVLCTKWNWVQPNGRLKDMACRELLLTLHRNGMLDYPPPKSTPCNTGKVVIKIVVDTTPVISRLSTLNLSQLKWSDIQSLSPFITASYINIIISGIPKLSAITLNTGLFSGIDHWHVLDGVLLHGPFNSGRNSSGGQSL